MMDVDYDLYMEKCDQIIKLGTKISILKKQNQRLVDALEKGLTVLGDHEEDCCMCTDDYECIDCRIESLWSEYNTILSVWKTLKESEDDG